MICIFQTWSQPHLNRGVLVQALPDLWTPLDGPRLYFLRRFMPPPRHAFVDLLAEQRR
ncbi:hypothetical protein [Cypionkella aquatica]|uniref:hypothetical protein n=1 Tax=Cypionkella aquatica TaxID=1756042 RepID=UPI0024E0E9A9|nr:hypothetical protein [Cypionkella aquatica]